MRARNLKQRFGVAIASSTKQIGADSIAKDDDDDDDDDDASDH